MSTVTIFRIAFWFLFGGLIVMQVYFASRVRQAGERVKADRNAIERRMGLCRRTDRSFPRPHRLSRAVRHQSGLARRALGADSGLAALGGHRSGGASFALYGWAQATLGKEWSPHLQIREQHHLVTTGPYARMRHPIYAAYIVFMTSIALVTANWFFIALLVVSVVVLALRIPKEEQMLIEVFGDEYKAYMQRTGDCSRN